jgi:hypothetical protein
MQMKTLMDLSETARGADKGVHTYNVSSCWANYVWIIDFHEFVSMKDLKSASWSGGLHITVSRIISDLGRANGDILTNIFIQVYGLGQKSTQDSTSVQLFYGKKLLHGQVTAD